MAEENASFFPPNCRLGHNETDIKPDADIVGIGVLTSFILSAWITWVAFVLAWYWYALPECFDNRSFRLILSHVAGDAIETGLRKRRIKAMHAITTSLSDQQLVLGMSILIAGLARYRTIDTYSINIVVDLAYIAVYVHIASVHFSDHPVHKHALPKSDLTLKAARTIVMTSNMAMLLFLMTLQLSWELHVQFLSFDCAVRHFLYLGWSTDDLASVLSFAIVVLDLISKYAMALSVLWTGHRDDPYVVVPNFLCNMYGMDEAAVRKLVQEGNVKQFSQAQQRAGGKDGRKRRAAGYAESLAFHTSRSAVEWQIVWYLFPLTFGTTCVLRDRQHFRGHQGLNSPGFGQVVALVLLLIPAFAAIASYNEYCSEKSGAINLQQEASVPEIQCPRPPTEPLARTDSTQTQAGGASTLHSVTPIARHQVSNNAVLPPQTSPLQARVSTSQPTDRLRNERQGLQDSTTGMSTAPDDPSTTLRTRATFRLDDSGGNLSEHEAYPHRSPTLDGADTQQALTRANTVPTNVSRLGRAIKDEPLTHEWVQGFCLFWYTILTLYTPIWGYFNSITISSPVDPWVPLFLLYVLFMVRVVIQFVQQFRLIRREGQRRTRKAVQSSPRDITNAPGVRMQNLPPAESEHR